MPGILRQCQWKIASTLDGPLPACSLPVSQQRASRFMDQSSTKIAKGFQTEIALKAAGLFLIPFTAGIIAANREPSSPDADPLQTLLSWIFIAGGAVWLLSLPYFFIVLTPKCDHCKVRTKNHGRMPHEGNEWICTTCPSCRERFRYRSFSGISG